MRQHQDPGKIRNKSGEGDGNSKTVSCVDTNSGGMIGGEPKQARKNLSEGKKRLVLSNLKGICWLPVRCLLGIDWLN